MKREYKKSEGRRLELRQLAKTQGLSCREGGELDFQNGVTRQDTRWGVICAKRAKEKS